MCFMSADFMFGRDGRRPLSRRRFVQGLAAGGVVAGIGWPRSPCALAADSPQYVLAGTSFDLVVSETPVSFTGHTRPAITVNASLPAPTLRWRQGATVELRVTNAIPGTSPR